MIRPIPRETISALLDHKDAVRRLGRASWLYLDLLRHATHDGLVIRKTAQLAQDLSVAESDVATWLSRLTDAKLLRVLSPSPFLTVRLCFWPAQSFPVLQNSKKTGNGGASTEGPAAAAADNNKQQQGDGGQGEGETLTAAAIKIFGETDAPEVRNLLARHPASAVRRALSAVQATPAHRIRKSRLALFRYLLAKFSETIDVRDL